MSVKYQKRLFKALVDCGTTTEINKYKRLIEDGHKGSATNYAYSIVFGFWDKIFDGRTAIEVLKIFSTIPAKQEETDEEYSYNGIKINYWKNNN